MRSRPTARRVDDDPAARFVTPCLREGKDVGPLACSESTAIPPNHDLDALYTLAHDNRMTLPVVRRIFDLRYFRLIAPTECSCEATNR